MARWPSIRVIGSMTMRAMAAPRCSQERRNTVYSDDSESSGPACAGFSKSWAGPSGPTCADVSYALPGALGVAASGPALRRRICGRCLPRCWLSRGRGFSNRRTAGLEASCQCGSRGMNRDSRDRRDPGDFPDLVGPHLETAHPGDGDVREPLVETGEPVHPVRFGTTDTRSASVNTPTDPAVVLHPRAVGVGRRSFAPYLVEAVSQFLFLAAELLDEPPSSEMASALTPRVNGLSVEDFGPAKVVQLGHFPAKQEIRDRCHENPLVHRAQIQVDALDAQGVPDAFQPRRVGIACRHASPGGAASDRDRQLRARVNSRAISIMSRRLIIPYPFFVGIAPSMIKI